MSISFHCESCKKQVKAPDSTGGKWGTCPHCDHRCYIPLPPAKDEEVLKLLPLDESRETQYNHLMAETRNLQRNIIKETEIEAPEPADMPFNEMDEKNLTKSIIVYLRLMADGELDQAQKAEAKILPFADDAKRILKDIVKAEPPEPELADIASKVLKGLAKVIYTKLK